MSCHEAHKHASASGRGAPRWATRDAGSSEDEDARAEVSEDAPHANPEGLRDGGPARTPGDPSGHNPAVGNSSPAGRRTRVSRWGTRANMQQHLEKGGAPVPLPGETRRRWVDAREFRNVEHAPARISAGTGWGWRVPVAGTRGSVARDGRSELKGPGSGPPAIQCHRWQRREGGQWKGIERGAPVGQNASHSSRVDKHPKEGKRRRET